MEFPFALQWIINEKKLKVLKDSENGFAHTRKFFVEGLFPVTYFSKIYPNGYNESSRGHTWIFLHFRDYDNEVEVKYSFKIEAANWLNDLKYCFTGNNGYGVSCCITNNLFNSAKKYIVDGKMIIKVDGFVQKKMVEIDSKKPENLGDCLWNSEGKDFEIVVKKQTIKAHKMVLAARSSVFATMFKSDYTEDQENKVKITDFPFEVVEFGIKRCYFNVEFNTLVMENNILLLQFFKKYDMDDFKKELENYFIKETTTSNVCSIVNCSLFANSQRLESYCTYFLLKCMKNSISVPNYASLNNEFAISLLGKSLSTCNSFTTK